MARGWPAVVCCSPALYNVLTRDRWLGNRKEREKQGEVWLLRLLGVLMVWSDSVGYRREGGDKKNSAAARVIVFIIHVIIIFQSGVTGTRSSAFFLDLMFVKL